MKLFTSRNHHISQKTCWGIHTETRTKLRLWVALDALKRSDQTIKALWTPRATETFQYCRSAHFRPLPPTKPLICTNQSQLFYPTIFDSSQKVEALSFLCHVWVHRTTVSWVQGLRWNVLHACSLSVALFFRKDGQQVGNAFIASPESL